MTWLQNTLFKPIGDSFKSMADILDNYLDLLKSSINKVLSYLGSLVKDKLSGNDKKKKAVGGDIQKTGMYELHAGERVLTAAKTKESSSKNMTINMPITVNASISNDIDIRQLARQLAAYSETELRRRVSY